MNAHSPPVGGPALHATCGSVPDVARGVGASGGPYFRDRPLLPLPRIRPSGPRSVSRTPRPGRPASARNMPIALTGGEPPSGDLPAIVDLAAPSCRRSLFTSGDGLMRPGGNSSRPLVPPSSVSTTFVPGTAALRPAGAFESGRRHPGVLGSCCAPPPSRRRPSRWPEQLGFQSPATQSESMRSCCWADVDRFSPTTRARSGDSRTPRCRARPRPDDAQGVGMSWLESRRGLGCQADSRSCTFPRAAKCFPAISRPSRLGTSTSWECKRSKADWNGCSSTLLQRALHENCSASTVEIGPGH